MSIRCLALALVLVTIARGASAAEGPTPLAWTALPPLPDPIGFAGSFAGASGDALIVGGGANFPGRTPWEGGTKAWTDRVFVLESPDGPWRELDQHLPTPVGYGVSIATPEGIACLGGSNAEVHDDAAFLLRYVDGRLIRDDLPPLPRPCANASGAFLDGSIYVAGGSETPDATEALRTFWTLDLRASLDDRRWVELPTWPGPARILAVAGARDGAFYLLSGAGLAPGPDGKPRRTYLVDAYRYRPDLGWDRIADLTRPAVAAPSPAAAIGSAHLLVLGGDDGTQVDAPPDAHRGFPASDLAYHTVTDTWVEAGTTPAPFVTTPLVAWRGGFVVPGGEERPGVRSPRVALARSDPRRVTFGAWNLLTLAIYPAIMLGIGLAVARKRTDADDFFRGGRKIPAWAAGLSIYATMLSSITFMAVPAKAYATDWGFFLNYPSLLLLAPIIIGVFLPFFRQLDVTSAYEYLERRFNFALRLFGCLSFIVFQVGRTGIVLYLPALALSTVSNLDIDACILGMGLLTIALTVFGGMEAVVWTDVAQTILLLAAALVSLALIAGRLDGGLAGAWELARDHGKLFGEVSWSADLTIATGWVVFFGQLFTNLISYTANQEVVQRYLSTEDERRAARAIWINALVSFPSGLLFFAVGTALYAFYRQAPGRLDPALARTDAIFPFFMVHELPPGVAGFVVAGIFAAAQPTSGLNSVATAFVADIHGRFRPGADGRAQLRAGRVATVVAGVLGIGAALTMVRFPVESLWELFLNILGLSMGILAGLFALGMLTRRAHANGAMGGVLVAAGVLAWVHHETRIYPLLYGAIAMIACCVAGYLLSLVLPGPRRPLAGLTIFTIDRGRSGPDREVP